MIKSVDIGLPQYSCVPDTKRNIEAAEAGVREAARKGAKLICLPELFHWTYFCTTENHEYFNLAESVDGPIVTGMRALAKELKIVLIVPFFERRAAGVYHNSAAVIEADGSLCGVYRKMHIPDDPLYYEKFYFTPGDAGDRNRGFKSFSTSAGRIGVLICWDQWYPEAARITALLGAEIIFYPTAIGWHPAEKAEFGKDQVAAWQGVQRGHAIANGVFVAAVNRVGHELTPGTEGIEFFGRSIVYDPFGRVIAEDTGGKESVLVTRCDFGKVEETRRHWPFLRDRRVDAYSPIVSRYIGESSEG